MQRKFSKKQMSYSVARKLYNMTLLNLLDQLLHLLLQQF